jgi:hypothetical protein
MHNVLTAKGGEVILTCQYHLNYPQLTPEVCDLFSGFPGPPLSTVNGEDRSQAVALRASGGGPLGPVPIVTALHVTSAFSRWVSRPLPDEPRHEPLDVLGVGEYRVGL